MRCTKPTETNVPKLARVPKVLKVPKAFKVPNVSKVPKAALPVLTQLVTSRLHAVHKAHRETRERRQNCVSQQKKLDFSRFGHLLHYFAFFVRNIFLQILPFHGLCPPSWGAVARLSTSPRAKDQSASARIEGHS